MAKPKIQWRRAAFREIRTLPAVQAELGKRAQRIADAANTSAGTTGYEASTYEGKSRARATVITSDLDSTLDNARDNTLLKNLDAGRGDA